jgi:hypothetical protein
MEPLPAASASVMSPFSFACAAKEKWIEAPPTRDHKALKPMLAQ